MQHDPAQISARSKLEFMYRDLLVECERVAQRNEALTQQLHEASIALAGAPDFIRKAASGISLQASAEAARLLQEASRAQTQACQDLQGTSRMLHAASVRNAWFTAGIAGLSGLLGGLVATLLTFAFA